MPKISKPSFSGLHDAFMSADANKKLTPQGSGGYDLSHDSLSPVGARQTAAQHAATVKAGKASGMKRALKSGKPIFGM
ncbi:hypothetical protein UFOVP155_49 [uncultured Caudovirales phage]|uniref:Uncharacterized protein n=1 Tax=uncultured Caudovirales phage TaxID=2100421 RepID=A0A6J7W9S9_9CAUD|nr:hypothetical protein UFOVP155_49 [uncultured Caudovirales phage]